MQPSAEFEPVPPPQPPSHPSLLHQKASTATVLPLTEHYQAGAASVIPDASTSPPGPPHPNRVTTVSIERIPTPTPTKAKEAVPKPAPAYIQPGTRLGTSTAATGIYAPTMRRMEGMHVPTAPSQPRLPRHTSIATCLIDNGSHAAAKVNRPIPLPAIRDGRANGHGAAVTSPQALEENGTYALNKAPTLSLRSGGAAAPATKCQDTFTERGVATSLLGGNEVATGTNAVVDEHWRNGDGMHTPPPQEPLPQTGDTQHLCGGLDKILDISQMPQTAAATKRHMMCQSAPPLEPSDQEMHEMFPCAQRNLGIGTSMWMLSGNREARPTCLQTCMSRMHNNLPTARMPCAYHSRLDEQCSHACCHALWQLLHDMVYLRAVLQVTMMLPRAHLCMHTT